MTEATQEKTGLGNYFVANYPPFSFWKPTYLPDAQAALDRAARARHAAGALPAHSRFAANAASSATSASTPTRTPATSRSTSTPSSRKSSSTASKPVVGGRPLNYVYFGGGTPSYLSATQLRDLMTRLKAIMPWDEAEEVTFECEPGTLAAAQARNPARAGRHAAEPRRRELRRRRSSSTTAGPISKRRSTAPMAGPANSASSRSTST